MITADERAQDGLELFEVNGEQSFEIKPRETIEDLLTKEENCLNALERPC